jgi:hypothetical protein
MNRPATKARVASFSGTSCLHQSCIHSVTMGCSTGQRQSHHVEEWFVDSTNVVLEETHSRTAGVECRIPQVGAPPGRGWETGAGAAPRRHPSPRSAPPGAASRRAATRNPPSPQRGPTRPLASPPPTPWDPGKRDQPRLPRRGSVPSSLQDASRPARHRAPVDRRRATQKTPGGERPAKGRGSPSCSQNLEDSCAL